MSKPTLLIKGNLQASKHSEPQEVLDQYLPIDYITNWFEPRIPAKFGDEPRIQAKSPADRILIIESSTGSGKSTTIPPRLYHLFQDRTRRSIFCSQPRVLTAIDIPKNTIPQFNTKEALTKAGFPNFEPLIFGQNIGTQTGAFTKKPIQGLIFGTPAIIVQQMNMLGNRDFMRKYSFILVDEAHERSIQIDTMLYMLKKFIVANYEDKNCPFVICMSATFDTIKFSDYMLSMVPRPERYKNIISVKGFTHEIKEIFLEYDSPNFISAIVDIVTDVHKNNPNDFLPVDQVLKNSKIYKLPEDAEDITASQKFRDILIFVKGPSEIKKLKKKISSLNTSHTFFKQYPVLCLGLTGSAVTNQSPEYRNAIERDISELSVEIYDGKKMSIKHPVRRVVIATNVAETGITIETLKYVIDPGWLYSKEFNPCFAVDAMIAKPVTQSMHRQRKGRVGRKHPGVCYSIFTETTYKAMLKDQYADIIKEDVTLEVLNILIREVDPENRLGEHDIHHLFQRVIPDELSEFERQINSAKLNLYNVDLLDVPSVDSMHYSLEKLYALGAINSNSIPTLTGFLMNKFRFIKIESIKMILAGFMWDAPIEDLIVMAAFLEQDKHIVFAEELADNFQKTQRAGGFTFFGNRQGRVQSYAENKNDLILADDFLKYVSLFYEIQKKIAEFMENKDALFSKDILSTLNDWLEDSGISAESVLGALEIRNDVMNVMTISGLNAFHCNRDSYRNIIGLGDHEKIEYVRRIKQCIFEGYKLNMAVWNPVSQRYYTRKTHLPLTIESEYIMSGADIAKYGDNNPKFIIYDRIVYFADPESTIYQPVVSHISVIDGFITVDPNYDSLV